MRPLAAGGFAGLGNALRWLRTRDHLTLAEVAEAAGVSASVLSRYENGEVSPKVETLGRVLAALDTDIHQLAVILRILQVEARNPLSLPKGLTAKEQSALTVASLGFQEFIQAVARRSTEGRSPQSRDLIE